MKILILSDSFVKEEIVREELENVLGGIEPLEFKTLQFLWPLNPFVSNGEILEYEGSEEEIIKNIGDAELVVLHGAPVSEAVLEAAKNLKAVAVIRGGPTNVNLNAATRRGVPVFNSPGRNAVAVVEFTVGLILAELKNIARAHMNMVQKNWRYDYYLYDKCNFELAGKVAGLVGFGNIAYRISGILKSLGMKVVSYDPFVPFECMLEYGVENVSFDELLARSDVVSLHARLTPQTKNMFNREAFKKMKSSALFVNTARGGLVSYPDLYEALVDGEIACAALDVFETEPCDMSSPLLQLHNVTLTPHIAGATKDTVHYGMSLLAKDLANFIQGLPVRNCMNPETLKAPLQR